MRNLDFSNRKEKFKAIFDKLLSGESFRYKETDHFSFRELIRLCIIEPPEDFSAYDEWEEFCKDAKMECGININLCTFREFISQLQDKERELNVLSDFLANSIYSLNEPKNFTSTLADFIDEEVPPKMKYHFKA